MKIRSAKKILNIMKRGTEERMNVTSIQKMESKKIVGSYLDLDICTKKL